MKRSYIREILDCIDEQTISFAGGLPNELLFDLNGIAKVANEVLTTPKALQYSASQGLQTLREHIALLYTTRFDMPTDEHEILITTGSQQAFDVILKIFAKDEMIVQNPSYIGAINAFKTLGLEVRSYDNHTQLKRYLNSSNDLYIMSDFCNPTGHSLIQNQRQEIAQILQNRGNILIEDGAYSLLSFNGKLQKPICAYYDNGFHLGSFSKILAPGLRVGWIRASRENIQKILVAKESMDLHTPTLNQMIIAQYLSCYSLEEQLQKVRQDYAKRALFMEKCMRKYLKEFEFFAPKGGMFIYGTFKNIDTMRLAKEALQHHVAFVPGQVFDPSERVSSNARFNFTNSSPKQIVKGIKILAKILHEDASQQNVKSIWMNIFQNISTHSKFRTCYL